MAQNASNAGSMDNTHSIIQFLQRPVSLGTLELDAGSVQDVAVPLKQFMTNDPQKPAWKCLLPGALLKAGGKDLKVANFEYFRADIKIKVVLNTNPFVGGRFYLTYAPYEQGNEVVVDQPRQLIYTSRAGVTAFPGIEIDIQVDNSVEMTIPYASYKEAYDLNSGVEDYLTLYLFNMCDMLFEASSKSHISFTFYGWLENIQLVIPTYRQPVSVTQRQQAQTRYVTMPSEMSAQDKKKIRQMDEIMKLEKSNPAIYQYILTTLQSLKSNPKPHKRSVDVIDSLGSRDVEMQVQAEAGSGIISSVAGTVKGIADAVGGINIPIVKEIAGTVGWVSDIVGGIASTFGWSRPIDMDRNICLSNIPGKNYCHIEAVDESTALALSSKNELEKPTNIFPTDVDEMSLDYVCCNPGLKQVISWPVNNTSKPVALTAIPVGLGPYNMDQYKFTSAGKDPRIAWITDTCPCEYVSQLFKYWRATMCYKITVVKTAFHVGRLEIFFVPGRFESKNEVDQGWYRPDITAYNDLVKTDSNNCYKYILDITNDTEVTVKIPYVSDQLFKSTCGVVRDVGMAPDGITPNTVKIDESYIGTLVIREVNPLAAPETVSQNVELLIWKWAEDVVLNAPQTNMTNGNQIWDPSQLDIASRARRDVEMQINIGNVASGNEVVFFDSAPQGVQNMDALKMACGERIMNLRSLLRCFRLAPFGQNYETKDVSPIEFSGETGNLQTITPNFQEKTHGFDYCSYISYMYRFFRGGYRVKLFFLDQYDKETAAGGKVVDTTSCAMQSWLSPVQFGAATVARGNRHEGPTHRTYANINPVHEISLPYYSQYRKLPISAIPDRSMQGLSFAASKPSKWDLYRAGNDDLTYGWLMGTPQLLLGLTNST